MGRYLAIWCLAIPSWWNILKILQNAKIPPKNAPKIYNFYSIATKFPTLLKNSFISYLHHFSCYDKQAYENLYALAIWDPLNCVASVTWVDSMERYHWRVSSSMVQFLSRSMLMALKHDSTLMDMFSLIS